ncbi:MAG TPA: HAMP domain-containing sensor histidine kinase [Nocardioidaceae bacterium]|nr:HAMP domain-containing sensor histidine kinase [Nocardioidaceae bacterium]
MKLPASLTSRLVMTAVGLVAAVSVLVSLATYVGMREVLLDRLDRDVSGFAGRPGLGPEETRLGLVVFYDDTGTVRQGTYFSPRGEDSAPDQLDEEQVLRATLLAVDGEVHDLSIPGLGDFRAQAVRRDVAVNGQAPITVTIVNGMSTDQVDETLSTLLLWELLLGLLGVGVAFGAGTVLVRRNLAPLREVAAVAQEVTRLELDKGLVGETVRVPERLTDETTEVGQVGASLNSLLGHMEQALDARHRSEQQVRQFVADASHELRTPLTTIRGYAELAGREPDVLPTSMGKVSEEAMRMSALVDDLLLLARLDSGRPLATEPVDLTHLVIAAVDDARVVDPERSWALALPPEPVTVTGDEDRLHQVVTNLLGNARRHTPAGTVVTSGISVADGSARLTVHDTGPGIPADVDVFERFTRGDSSRTRGSGGAGLGLSLVAAIVAAHGGTVAVQSRPGATEFTVTLPQG